MPGQPWTDNDNKFVPTEAMSTYLRFRKCVGKKVRLPLETYWNTVATARAFSRAHAREPE